MLDMDDDTQPTPFTREEWIAMLQIGAYVLIPATIFFYIMYQILM